MAGERAWFALLGMNTPSVHFKKHSIGSNTIPISMSGCSCCQFQLINLKL